MKIKPLQEYLLLEVVKYDDPKSGIVLPTHLRKKLPIGKILEVGDYCKKNYTKGEMIVFNKSGTKAIPNTNLVLCPEHRVYFEQEWIRKAIKEFNKIK